MESLCQEGRRGISARSWRKGARGSAQRTSPGATAPARGAAFGLPQPALVIARRLLTIMTKPMNIRLIIPTVRKKLVRWK